MASIRKLVVFFVFLIVSFIFVNLNHPSFSQERNTNTLSNPGSTNEKIIIAQSNSLNDKPLLVFGFSADSPPISNGVSSLDRGIDPSTFCGNLYKTIEEAFSEDYKIDRVPMYSGHRFQGFQGLEIPSYGTIENKEEAQSFLSKNIGLECGPNSIRGFRVEELKDYEGAFSKSFYTTSAKILINKNDRALLYQDDFPLAVATNSDTGSKIIAVVGGTERTDSSSCPELTDPTINTRIGGTTTVDAINTIYGSTVKEYTVRDQALDCLTKPNSQTLAYSTDHILLQGLLNEFQDNYDNLKDFVIEPRTQNLTYERYGVVLYGKLDESLQTTVNNWIDDIGIPLMNSIESDLSDFEYTIEEPITRIFWRPIEDFYRAKLPIFLASSGTILTFALFAASIFLLGLFLTHRFIAKILSRIFPQLFQFIIDTRRYLRKKGDDQNNGFLKWLGSFGLISEEIYALALKENQGHRATNISEIDDYDIANILAHQLRIIRRVEHISAEERKDPEEITNAIVQNVSQQMKHNPRTQSIISEWSEWIRRGGDQFVDNFGTTFGRELAVRLIELTVGRGQSTS